MFDYQKCFNEFIKENNLKGNLSFNMPEGFETAQGMYDPEANTLYVNKAYLEDTPEYGQAFFFYHECRHMYQYLKKNEFDGLFIRSMSYVIQYDGKCFNEVSGEYKECVLEGKEEDFVDLYKSQPYELDANEFAYKMAVKLYGESEDLDEIFNMCARPSRRVSNDELESIYKAIDEKIK